MSPAEKLAMLDKDQRNAALDILLEKMGINVSDLEHHWPFWARPKQVLPDTDCQCGCKGRWLYWLLLAGRGFGKTRVGAETIHEWANSGTYGTFHLVGATAADARDIMVLGDSGMKATQKPYNKIKWSPTNRRITWEDGATALLFSADEPERLRGVQCHAAWSDELASWRYQKEAWEQLQLGLRLGSFPRNLITTTPRPTVLIKKLAKDDRTHITTGSTYENASNLAEVFLHEITRNMEGTRFGRQEIYAEILEDSELALWSRDLIEEHRVAEKDAPNHMMKKIVIGVDPAISFGQESAETGIAVAGMTKDSVAYLLLDATGKFRPEEWAQKAVTLYKWYNNPTNPLGAADVRIVAEQNQGGLMVEHTIRAYGDEVPVKLVNASKNKITRAEPVSTAMERGRIKHLGIFPELEEQMCSWEQGDPESPDRMDAMVWAMTELVGGHQVVTSMAIGAPILQQTNYWKEIDLDRSVEW